MNSSTSTSESARRAWWLLPLLCALLLPTYNWVQDYYGIFGQRQDWRGVIPNERYHKFEALRSRREEITTLLFGSSKAANIPFAENLGNGAYNFAYSEGLPRDHLEVLNVLVEELPALQRVYIAVDEMAYLLDPGRHATDYLRRQHPVVAGEPGWRFHLDYLLRPLSNTDALYFDPQRQQRPQVSYQFQTTGRSLCESCDTEIDADPAAHAQQAFFRFPYNPPDQYGLQHLRADLAATLNLLAANDIEAILFLQPTFANNLRWHNLGMLELLKAMLAELGPFHDFLVYEESLADTVNFYDVIHFRPNVGQRMMDILTAPDEIAPGGFGHRVSVETLKRHNARVREQIVGPLVPVHRYRQDREYSHWQQESGFRRVALDSAPARAALAAEAEPLSCRLDTVNRARFAGKPVRIAFEDLGMLEFGGWSKLAGMQPTGYFLVREQGFLGKDRAYAMATALSRPDVAGRFGEQFAQVGFRGNLDISDLRRGNYLLEPRFENGAGDWFACDKVFRLVVL